MGRREGSALRGVRPRRAADASRRWCGSASIGAVGWAVLSRPERLADARANRGASDATPQVPRPPAAVRCETPRGPRLARALMGFLYRFPAAAPRCRPWIGSLPGAAPRSSDRARSISSEKTVRSPGGAMHSFHVPSRSVSRLVTPALRVAAFALALLAGGARVSFALPLGVGARFDYAQEPAHEISRGAVGYVFASAGLVDVLAGGLRFD